MKWNLVNMNSRGPTKMLINYIHIIMHISRDFTVIVASCTVPGDFKVVRMKRVFCFNSCLTRFHCTSLLYNVLL